MLQAQRNVSGPTRQQEQQVSLCLTGSRWVDVDCRVSSGLLLEGSPKTQASLVPKVASCCRYGLQVRNPSRLSPQVARTITNLQQQIQQHQRQLAQALLVKPPPPHLSLHPAAGKPAADSFPPHPPDLQTKEQQSPPNSFAPYPLGEPPASLCSPQALASCGDPGPRTS